eukprot:92469-Pyramimonas_sp.AAC.2
MESSTIMREFDIKDPVACSLRACYVREHLTGQQTLVPLEIFLACAAVLSMWNFYHIAYTANETWY